MMHIKSEYGLRWTRRAININLTVAEARDKSPPSISCAYYRQTILRTRSRVGKSFLVRAFMRRMLRAEKLEVLSLSPFLSLPPVRRQTARGVLTKPSYKQALRQIHKVQFIKRVLKARWDAGRGGRERLVTPAQPTGVLSWARKKTRVNIKVVCLSFSLFPSFLPRSAASAWSNFEENRDSAAYELYYTVWSVFSLSFSRHMCRDVAFPVCEGKLEVSITRRFRKRGCFHYGKIFVSSIRDDFEINLSR